MSRKAAKKTKVATETTTASESEEEITCSLVTVTNLIKSENKELYEKLMTAVLKLEGKLDQSIEAITQMQKRVQEVEQLVHLTTDSLEKKMNNLDLKYNNLSSRLVNLEGRSRRQNIRILGVKEGIEKGLSPVTVFAQLLTDLVGKEAITGELLVDRAYRIPSFRGISEARPRVVIVCCHYYHQKEQIIQVARRKKDLNYQGQSIRLVEDLCPEVLAMRRKFHGVMQIFYNEGLRPVMQYPARLRIVLKDGQKRFFISEEQARNALSEILPGSSDQLVLGMG